MFLVPNPFAARPKPASSTLPDFAGIVREHQAMVYSIGWNFLRNHATAEEVAQDVFLQLHRNLGSIESPAHLTNWLRRVTTQRCIDAVRRARVRPQVALDRTAEPSAPGHQPDPLLAGRLDRLIDELPERAKMIVVLRYQEEMEPAEIAETLAMPVGTVKSSLHRALALMRGRLEKQQSRISLGSSNKAATTT